MPLTKAKERLYFNGEELPVWPHSKGCVANLLI